MVAVDDAREEVDGWLQLSVTTGKYSSGFVTDLAEHMVNRSAHVHLIYDEIKSLEGLRPAKPSMTKRATAFKREPLIGLYHKHYFQPKFILANIINHWNDARMSELESGPADQLLHKMVIGGFQSRAQTHLITGEWIVFAKHEGKNIYFALGKHDDDETTLARVLACRDEFPEIEFFKNCPNR